MGPAGKALYIAEMLSQANELLDDAVWVEANEMSGHEFAFRDSIPAGYWRMVNTGVPYSKSTTGKSRVGIGSLEDYSQIDRWLAESSGDIAGYREGEDSAFLEGMAQTWTETSIYGNTVANPAQFMGLAGFYNTIAGAQNGANIIDAGGVGNNNTSMWLVCHGERTIFWVFPRGSKGGLVMEDKGTETPGYDNLGNRFEAYTAYFRQQGGLCPQDWRQAARIANIDVTAAGLAGPNAPDLFALMTEMMYLPPALGKMQSGITKTDAPRDPTPGIRPVLYANRTLRHYMDLQGMRQRNVLLSVTDYAGVVTDVFRKIPVKLVDELLTTEARVV